MLSDATSPVSGDRLHPDQLDALPIGSMVGCGTSKYLKTGPKAWSTEHKQPPDFVDTAVVARTGTLIFLAYAPGELLFGRRREYRTLILLAIVMAIIALLIVLFLVWR